MGSSVVLRPLKFYKASSVTYSRGCEKTDKYWSEFVIGIPLSPPPAVRILFFTVRVGKGEALSL